MLSISEIQALTPEQIDLLPIEEVKAAEELAQTHLDNLLRRANQVGQRKLSPEQSAELNRARRQYLLLRARCYPKHPHKIKVAGTGVPAATVVEIEIPAAA